MHLFLKVYTVWQYSLSKIGILIKKIIQNNLFVPRENHISEIRLLKPDISRETMPHCRGVTSGFNGAVLPVTPYIRFFGIISFDWNISEAS